MGPVSDAPYETRLSKWAPCSGFRGRGHESPCQERRRQTSQRPPSIVFRSHDVLFRVVIKSEGGDSMIEYYRGRPNHHTLVFRNGKVVRQGAGIGAVVAGRSTVSEVPTGVIEARLSFGARSSDLQPVRVDGVAAFRVAAPAKVASAFDFSARPGRGEHRPQGVAALKGSLAGITRDIVRDEVSRLSVDRLLGNEPALGRAALVRLRHSPRIRDVGVRPVEVFVKEVRLPADITRALETRACRSVMAGVNTGSGGELAMRWRSTGDSLGEVEAVDLSARVECTDSCPFRHLCGDYQNNIREGRAWCTLFREFTT